MNNLTVVTWIIKRALTGSIPDKSYATFFYIRLVTETNKLLPRETCFLNFHGGPEEP